MLINMGRNKKSSAPRCRTPETGSGRINAPHGTELYVYGKPWTQKMPTVKSAVLSACFKCTTLQRWGLFFNPQTLNDIFSEFSHLEDSMTIENSAFSEFSHKLKAECSADFADNTSSFLIICDGIWRFRQK